MTPILLDTGVIVALLDRRERFHSACVAAIESVQSQLVTCEAVITEAGYLLRKFPRAADAIVRNVETGVFRIPFRLTESAPSLRPILRKYADREIDFADACLIHMANELRTGEILTLDGDFRVYRWGNNKPFRLLPE